ncbi:MULTISPECIES: OsmC family protein [unclassified Leeuwenhoekiella]|uniref:OsmC family protein n=1 Tax=unclassified Leeuwenhoekiella TaxID=2615029 RepID=UPI000C6A839B|nr:MULTISPECIES: OsmC family protein [unclassified Leeuwenhoekiella]MAW95140.1 osmotically inducible protein OsmC [Leeuwenhoekiella sp.]MBA79860.1 osmotically inducible protein OsmC [Leeuwenhoekiella sp.]|tara:strand:- start:473 stop:877 length:405 start_codon:yes stop_codon:yes gene_type:complete
MTSKVVYLGDLRTSCEHLKSGNTFITDAPVDNNGKGAPFSPTDTVATALASCMLTVMGIKGNQMGAPDLKGSIAEVTKVMAAEPRRISRIEVKLTLYGIAEEKQRRILENTARTCPVLQSLHPDMEKVVFFDWK